MKRCPFYLALYLLLSLGLGACGQPSADAHSTPDSAVGTQTSETEQPATPLPESAETVTYEPAYPEEVSRDGLDAEDTAQQTTHSHDGEEHTHSPGASHGENDHPQSEQSAGGGAGDQQSH